MTTPMTMGVSLDFDFLSPKIVRDIFIPPKASEIKKHKDVRVLDRDRAYVYMLVKQDSVVYVGFTEALRRRIKQHEDSGRDFDEVLYIEADQFTADCLEGALISFLQPVLNAQGASMPLGRIGTKLIIEMEFPGYDQMRHHPNCPDRLRRLLDLHAEGGMDVDNEEDLKRLAECAGIDEPRKPSHTINRLRTGWED